MSWIYNLLNKTKKSAFFYSLLLIIPLTFISSCSMDVLDKDPINSFNDAAVWNDGVLTEQFVNNTYKILPTGFSSVFTLGRVASDEMYNRGGAFNFINEGNISPTNYGILNFWTGSWTYWNVIKKCNIFLSNIDAINAAPGDVAFKNRMKGEMYFMRAFSYFRLVALYGGVPLLKKPSELAEEFRDIRNSYDDCMKFVIEDLDAAIAMLPATYPAANLGRITKGAAMSIKSRALLYMASPLNNPANTAAKWQAAADAAKAVIDLNLYSLFNNYGNVFQLANSYNSEIIWSRPYNFQNQNEGVLNETISFPNGYGGQGQIAPYQNLVDEFEMLSGKLPKDDPTYDLQNPYINRDPRFYASILYNGATFKGRAVETFLPNGKDSRGGALSPNDGTETGYYMRKFLVESITNPSSSNTGNSPWIFIRYAEILLNYAEAKYNLGDEATCREYINKVRSRTGVNMPPVTDTGAALLARVQHERQIELVFEEHRYFDVRRWKIAPVVLNKLPKRMDIVKNLTTGVITYEVKTMLQFTFVFNDRNYLLPVPQSEIDKNPALEQNPGYLQ
ncbi:MAG: RagB/SusD family nutrient uptake outer membrane protein [Prolixibacteraceae bacterium]|jgi:hypothetical protein|nr:RagB/SusD family nutrient uptake outer membrane protein [Prolixibacteraceae bacterium]